MHDNSSLARYLTNRLWEFHQIYNLCVSGDENKHVRFWGQKIKVQGHSATTCGQISTYGDIFSPLSGIYGRILMKLIKITHYQVYMTLVTFLRSWVQRSRSQTTFPSDEYWSTVRKLRAVTPYKVIKVHRYRYQSKAHMRLPIND